MGLPIALPAVNAGARPQWYRAARAYVTAPPEVRNKVSRSRAVACHLNRIARLNPDVGSAIDAHGLSFRAARYIAHARRSEQATRLARVLRWLALSPADRRALPEPDRLRL